MPIPALFVMRGGEIPDQPAPLIDQQSAEADLPNAHGGWTTFLDGGALFMTDGDITEPLLPGFYIYRI